MLGEPEFDFEEMRAEMVEHQLKARGITDSNVLAAMGTVPRHEFVQPVDWDEAYEDHPLAIACSQTISQPYIVALMTQMLELSPGNKVLEIGTGCGYQSAVLAELGCEVYSVERHRSLSQLAAKNLEKCGYSVNLKVADGSLGWAENAPYERIIMTCCAPELKEGLIGQLANGGIMVAPVARGDEQILQTVSKSASGEITVKDGIYVVFVPLIGENGYKS